MPSASRTPWTPPTVGVLNCRNNNERTLRYAHNQPNTTPAVSTYTYDAPQPAKLKAAPDEEELAVVLNWLDAAAEEGQGPA